MILIIDNYDSFTQNLYQYIGALGKKTIVKRNDEISTKDIATINPTHIIISPGPGQPNESGICLDVIRNYSNQIPILGICLGHQGIGYTYGSKIKQLRKPTHGKVSNIIHNKQDLFMGLPNPLEVSRYHSLVIDDQNLPSSLEVTAWTSDGTIMACRHKIYQKLRGIQFHPESLWTTEGKKILSNFLLF
uniref:Anthranilate synthase component 2 n=1 Tax=Laurenciella marilzae TaxID=1413812 RepID=A0A1Z1M0X4_9FLOR|nr:Anthranilate synthase component II [Laurenciella marilzae]ARW59719.1 Anthranilate synthase component II [Laurenciella marilzae]